MNTNGAYRVLSEIVINAHHNRKESTTTMTTTVIARARAVTESVKNLPVPTHSRGRIFVRYVVMLFHEG